MALAALAEEDLWHRVIQHRFAGTGDLEGHALGNLVLVALWEETGDIVAGLEQLGTVLGVRGRVLPNCLEPVQVIADVTMADGSAHEIRGQANLTTMRGRVDALRLNPDSPPACPDAVSAISEASHVVIGPGSWFTSVLPHVLIPDIAEALRATSALRILVLNASPQPGETEGFTANHYLDAWAEFAPDISLDLVIADPPWTYASTLGRAAPGDRYACLSVSQIAAHLHPLRERSPLLALWLTWPLLGDWSEEWRRQPTTG
jgi:uncharacterized cofD-like protein